MTNLKIGTILIAKEDRNFPNGASITKGKEYKIDETPYGYYQINTDNITSLSTKETIDLHYTIKRYTLSDLQEKKIAVKLRNEEEFKKVLNILDVRKSAKFYKNEKYYGIDDDGDFYYLLNEELEGRTLLESIDLIDLEVKEEVKETYTCKYCGATLSKDVDEEDCYANPNKNHDSTTATLINSLKSEIARLKGELEKSQEAGKCIAEMLTDEKKAEVALMEEVNRLKGEKDRLQKSYDEALSMQKTSNNGYESKIKELEKENASFVTANLYIMEKYNELLQSTKTTPDLTKRERMAWEIWLQGRYTVEQAIEKVNKFLEESKEVGNGNV